MIAGSGGFCALTHGIRRIQRSSGPGVDENGVVVTVADVRALALTLPRTTEHLIRDRVKFRVKQIVYCAFSRDETLMGFGFPKEERDVLVAAEPATYLLPKTSDLRFNWVVARVDQLDVATMEERVCDAWAMCVPKFLIRERLG
jgi:hypothetical protein